MTAPDPLDWLDLDELAATKPRPGWETDGACYQSGKLDRFFPDDGASSIPAKAMCARCPVRMDCLAANLLDGHGVWGGTSVRDRRRIRRDLLTHRGAA